MPQPSVGGARFWVSNGSQALRRLSPDAIKGATGRLLVVVDHPESLVAHAVATGAEQTSAVAVEHGWQLGRLTDPFGHEWEVGQPLIKSPPPHG